MAHPGQRGPRPPRAWSAAARLPLLTLGLAAALLGCTRPDTGIVAAAVPGASHVSLEHALDAMLRPDSATAAEAFLRSLPEPRAVHDTTVPNMHDPRWHDTVRTLVFDGLDVMVYRVRSTGARFPVALRVTSPAYTSPDGLRVGITGQQLEAILGKPSESQGSTLIYRFVGPGSAPYELTVELRGGRVSALRWTVYVD